MTNVVVDIGGVLLLFNGGGDGPRPSVSLSSLKGQVSLSYHTLSIQKSFTVKQSNLSYADQGIITGLEPKRNIKLYAFA